MSEIDDSQKRIAKEQKRLDALKKSRDIERIKTDESLQQAIQAIEEIYESGDYSAVNDLAIKIYKKTKLKQVSFESDPDKEFEDFLAHGEPRKLPDWFELNRIEILGGSMVMIGALPKRGKTSTAINITAWNNLHDIKTLYLSNEMRPIEVRVRLFQNHIYRTKNASLAFMDVYRKLRDPVDKYDEAMLVSYKRFSDELNKNVVILNANMYTADDYCLAMENSINYFGIHPQFTILDYVQRIKGNEKTLRDTMINASRATTSTAQEIGTVLIALSQMNKDGGYKESGVWEEDATINIVLEVDPEAPGLLGIKIKSSRFTADDRSNVDFSKVSGAIG